MADDDRWQRGPTLDGSEAPAIGVIADKGHEREDLGGSCVGAPPQHVYKGPDHRPKWEGV